jgi:hypothetical protein
MRTMLVALSLAAAAAVPASAAPRPHAVLLGTNQGGTVTVTCDTSSYPASRYPCGFAVTMSGPACVEYALPDPDVTGLCSFRLTGGLHAVPAPDSAGGTCVFEIAPEVPIALDFQSGIDPAYHVARAPLNVSFHTVVQSAEVSYGINGRRTPYVVSFAVPDSTLMFGELTAGFSYTDIEPDCRTRAGGDPVTSAPRAGEAPVGVWELTRS